MKSHEVKSMKTIEEIDKKLVQLSGERKVGTAGGNVRGWIDALHWVRDKK